ncbi:hypothetical protein A9993_08430 [Rahnella victoriana]|uniref:hypothetical protein n=1 Tax=Rahnella victoriana TaxID=1510570 RepID=UPI000BB1E5C0|nr:hypothetical protein [Rahnella victoriana]PBI79764.1 hypothetical protein A9993_08430 [Rahnella victoriana]
MSSKINICEIVTGHFRTLKDADTRKVSKLDMFTFLMLPIGLAILFATLANGMSKDLVSLLVNFSAILTALLLSVLVLVYDQESKINQNKDNDTFYESKKTLLTELYYNICYSVLCGVFLVALCFFSSMYESGAGGYISGYDRKINFEIYSHYIDFSFNFYRYILCPFIIFFCVHLMLNIVMIVKRMHSLLTIS